MTGIYSGPIQHPGQPENAMRARAGLRPLCFNRPDFPAPMSPDCKAWAVREPDPKRPDDAGEDPAAEAMPAREGWRCWGCRRLPSDPRVRAKASETW
jgi:hypothetical protein